MGAQRGCTRRAQVDVLYRRERHTQEEEEEDKSTHRVALVFEVAANVQVLLVVLKSFGLSNGFGAWHLLAPYIPVHLLVATLS